MIGGLGNQLFQYALGRRLALICNTSLKLDIRGFSTYYKLHKYSLFHFNIDENFVTSEEAGKYRNFFSRAFVECNQRIFGNKLGTYYQRNYVKECTEQFDENILKVPSDVYIEGYWQTEKYFKEIAQQLRQEFTFKTPPSETNRLMGDVIKRNNSVSIHIRRTDYVTDAASNQDHGVCGLPYYRRAMTHISERVETPHFYVFSDDMNWVKANLRSEHATTYVDFNNADTNFEDLRLMSLCKHNIIANSTFSWWGAWLNQNDGKIVIAPEKWYASNRSFGDVVPKEWIKM